jgi:hypothetical protein
VCKVLARCAKKQAGTWPRSAIRPCSDHDLWLKAAGRYRWRCHVEAKKGETAHVIRDENAAARVRRQTGFENSKELRSEEKC